MGSRAFWAVVFGFLLGVFVRSFFLVGWSLVSLFVLLGAVYLLYAMGTKSNCAVLVGLACVAFSFGVARMQLSVVTGDPSLTRYLGENVVLTGSVVREPDARERSTLLTIHVDRVGKETEDSPANAMVLAQLPAHARLVYGDRVVLQGTLKLPESFEIDDSGRTFNYPQYLAAQGIGYTLRYAKLVAVSGGNANPLQSIAINAKDAFLHGLDAVMPDPEAALAGGITVGDKRSIGTELSAEFQRDSLIHMVVLSGYNITVVLNAIACVLARAPRYVQFSGSGVVVIFFICMAGGASSATRAGLMALVAAVARATHRLYLGERVLAAVSLAMVAWNPWTLCFDPSFQLSALATLGLILFTPLFSRVFGRVPEKFGTREILASTCATQLMVLPLLLYQNGTLSLVALPANLFALLPVPSAMFFSLVGGVAGMVFGQSASLVAAPAYVLLWCVISTAKFFANLPFAATSVPSFNSWWLGIAYGALFAMHLYTKKKATEADDSGRSKQLGQRLQPARS